LSASAAPASATKFEADPVSPVRAYYVVIMLMIAYMLSLLDRVLLGFLIEPVRLDLGLSDTQIGLLLGFGFALFYSVLGVPLGALADRGNRRNLIVVGLLIWTLATAATGFAGGFIAILLARTMVGAGEAALSPCAVSTIGDSFPRHKVGFALSIFSIGGAVGIGVATAVGGYLAAWTAGMSWSIPALDLVLEGWRLVFVIVGFAGLPFALLFMLTVREAPRKATTTVHPPMSRVFSHMNSNRSAFFGLFFGFGMQVLSTYIPMLWAAAHFHRLQGLGPLQLGLAFALIFGLASSVGVLVGGKLSDRAIGRGISDAPARVLFWAIPVQVPFVWLAFTLDDATLALFSLGVQSLVASMYGGLQGAMVQLLSPSNMHGRMMAIYLLSITVTGMGVGPLIVGALSQYVFSGNGALGYAMATTMTVAMFCAAVILTVTRNSMKQCIAKVTQLG